MRLSVIHHLVLATVIFTLILIAGILIVSHTAVINGIEKIEGDAASKTAEKIVAVLSLEGDNLARLAYDWGVWDDTYVFIGDRNDGYIRSNLALQSPIGIRVNDILFFDTKGNPVYAISVDIQNESVRKTSDELITYLQISGIVGSDALPRTGIVPLKSGPVLISTHPIWKSDESGPSRGTLIMSRDLDKARIDYLSSYTLYPFILVRNDGNNQSITPHYEQSGFLSGMNINEKFIETSSVITDISGNSSYLAKLNIPFNSPYTREFLWLMILLVAGLSTLFFVSILLYYRYYLTKNVSVLSLKIDEVIRTGSSSDNPSVQVPYEITCLAETAERVTQSLIQSKHDLNRSTEELEEVEERWQILFEEALDPMCVGNEDSLIYANRSWMRMLGWEQVDVVNIPIRDMQIPLLQDGVDPLVTFIREYSSVPEEESSRFDWRLYVSGVGEAYFDVTIKWIRFRGLLLRYVVAREVTDEVRIQKKLVLALAKIDENLVQLSSLNDEIRNPLTIICGLLDQEEDVDREGILLQVERIDKLIDRLDHGYVGTEKIRSYLKRYHKFGM